MSTTDTTSLYLLAKYIPDFHRFEPRNIGVIVWSPSGLEGRFIGEKEGNKGEVDGRKIPSFVTSAEAYKQWIRYWRTCLEQNELSPLKSGQPSIPRNSKDFVETLKASNKGNFVLVNGGLLIDKLHEGELSTLADELYSSLVEIHTSEEPRDLTLDEVCEDLLKKTKLNENPSFKTGFKMKCKVAGVDEEYTFSHAYQNGTLERLYQKVPLPKQPKMLQKNVHDVAWMFEKVIAAKLINRDKTSALVYLNEEQQANTTIASLLKILGSLTNVINLQKETDKKKITHDFRDLAKTDRKH